MQESGKNIYLYREKYGNEFDKMKGGDEDYRLLNEK